MRATRRSYAGPLVSVIFCLQAGFLRAAVVSQKSWDHEFEIYSSTSAPMIARVQAHRHLRVLDPKRKLPFPGLKTSPIFLSSTTVSAPITRAHGGLIVRQDRAALTVPPSAAQEDFTATISSPIAHHPLEELLKGTKMKNAGLLSVSTGIELQPDGMKFSGPITVEVPYDYLSAQTQGLHELDLQIFVWNRDKQIWESQITNIDLDHHVASAQIVHFSLYKVLGRRPFQRRR